MPRIIMPPVFPCDAKRQKLSFDERAANEQLTKMKCFSGILDPDMVNLRGETALMHASGKGDLNLVKALVSRGANINMATENGTALTHAIRRRRAHVAEFLLEIGAKLDVEHASTARMLCGASENGHTNLVELLLRGGAKVKLSDSYGDTALNYAIRQGHVNVVELLVKYGAGVGMTNKNGDTALTCAIKEGRADVVERVPSHLIVHAVMDAIRFNKPQLVELLLEHNARLDEAYKNVKEILMHAVRLGKARVVKVLLKHILKHYASVVVNDADNILTSALMSACFRGEVAIVRALLNAGICVNTVDPETKDTPLMLAIRHYNFDLTNLLIKHKANVNAACEHGETPLMYACRFGHFCAISMLIEAKVDVNKKNDDGQTPLMYASECGHQRIAEMLIFNGAAVDETDVNGKTAFDYARSDDVTNVLNRAREIRIGLLS